MVVIKDGKVVFRFETEVNKLLVVLDKPKTVPADAYNELLVVKL